jgi:hypothetical protein
LSIDKGEEQMDKRELRAKSIAERIVADLNKRFGFKLKITSGETHKGPFSSSDYKYLRIQYPNGNNDFCSFCFDEVRHGLQQKQPTYVQLLNRLIKDNVMTYHNDGSHVIEIELNSLYGKTFDEIEIALDLANGAAA